ncbi:hypothetical protein B4O83_14625 [Chromohalobacter israelensis]|nr:hypothetical protein B4O83_14625 [Chromohalobacter salexigens]
MSERAVLLSQIRKIYDDSGGRYGSPRVHQTLRREGVTVGENRVAKVMQQWGMRARVTCVYRRLARRRHELKALPNHRLEPCTGRCRSAVEQRRHLHQAGFEIRLPGGGAGSVLASSAELAIG